MLSHGLASTSSQASLLTTIRGSQTLARLNIRIGRRRYPLRPYHTDSVPVKPLRLSPGHYSLLPLVHYCNNLILPHTDWRSDAHHIVGSRTPEGDIYGEEPVAPFLISHSPQERPVGYVRPQVAAAIEDDHQKHFVSGSASPWDLRYTKDSPKRLKSVAFAEWVNEGGLYTRTMHMDRIVSDWQKKQMFKDVMTGWSDEPHPVYMHPPPRPHAIQDPVAFAIERVALPLFGLVNTGCFLTAYVRDPDSGRTMLWIPRRSMKKKVWPGKLDVTVGGGMGLGDSAMTTIIRESAEEALLDSDYVQEHIRPVGVLPFANRSPGNWILPGMYYLFDLPLPSDGSITPRINALDGEVEGFELLDVEIVLQYLLEGQFKSSSALAIIDFLLRHGFVTEETDPRYLDVCRLLKADINLPVAWRIHP
ncbi:hypothetical protein B0H34DRAFT_748229 [Crassisporium funariophilum]|nr:hypothetical protein B0H34DRAFT_748229 [Crassisporium funariophilum]